MPSHHDHDDGEGLTMRMTTPKLSSMTTTRGPSSEMSDYSRATAVGSHGASSRNTTAGGSLRIGPIVETLTESCDRGTSRTFNASTEPSQERGDAGAVLILVMIFMIITTVLIGSLASWAINDLSNVSTFKNVSAKLYAAGGATEVAMRASRYVAPSCVNPTRAATPCGYVCPPWTGPVDINNSINTVNIEDWCVTYTDMGTISREEVLSACSIPSGSSLTGFDQTTGQCIISGTSTEAPVLLTATVDFYDIPANPSLPPQYCNSPTNESTCGLGMTIVSWVAR